MIIRANSTALTGYKTPSFGTVLSGDEFFSKVNGDVLVVSHSDNPAVREAAKNRLFAVSDVIIRDILKKFSNKYYDKTDAYQEVMLKFFEMLEGLKDVKNPSEVFQMFFQKFSLSDSVRTFNDSSSIEKAIYRDSHKTVGDMAVETVFDVESSLDYSPALKELRETVITDLMNNTANNEKDVKILSYHFSDKNKNSRISQTAREFNVSQTRAKDYLNRAIVHIQSDNGILPAQAQNFVEDFKKNFPESGLDKKDILNVFIRSTSMSAEQSAKNADFLVQYFDSRYFTKKIYSNSFKYFPALFFQPPEKTIENVEGVIKELGQHGLTKDMYLKALSTQPQYYQSPETVVNNIKGLAQKFAEYGMTEEKAVKCALKAPRMFFQTPETALTKTKEAARIFKKEGLTKEAYFKAMMKHPALFCLSPERVEGNIKTAAELLKDTGLTLKDFLSIAMKQPTVMTLRPELTSEHIKIVQFIRKDDRVAAGRMPMNTKELVEASSSLPLGYSKENSFLVLLNKKIARCLGDKCLLNTNLKETLPARISKINIKSFNFDVVEDRYAQEFIDFARDFSQKHFGRNIFKINIVQELKEGAELFKYLR